MKKKVLSASLFVCYIILSFVTTPALNAAESTLKLQDVWVREAPPSAKVMAAFLVIENSGKSDRKLLSVEAEGFNKVEMHQTMIHGKMTHMVPQKDLSIPAGESLTLKPGGYHLMLMKPLKVFKAGDKVSLRFKFKDGEIVVQEAEVRRVKMGMDDHDHSEHAGH